MSPLGCMTRHETRAHNHQHDQRERELFFQQQEGQQRSFHFLFYLVVATAAATAAEAACRCSQGAATRQWLAKSSLETFLSYREIHSTETELLLPDQSECCNNVKGKKACIEDGRQQQQGW